MRRSVFKRMTPKKCQQNVAAGDRAHHREAERWSYIYWHKKKNQSSMNLSARTVGHCTATRLLMGVCRVLEAYACEETQPSGTDTRIEASSRPAGSLAGDFFLNELLVPPSLHATLFKSSNEANRVSDLLRTRNVTLQHAVIIRPNFRASHPPRHISHHCLQADSR